MKSLRRFGATLLAVVALILAPVAPSYAAALSITAANVIWQSGAVAHGQTAGEAFVAGALVYLSASNTWLKAQDDGTAIEAGSSGLGIALGTADVAGAIVSIATSGATVALGTGTAGTVYGLCDTAGSICPVADAGTTDKQSPIGVGIGSNKIYIQPIYNAGSVVP